MPLGDQPSTKTRRSWREGPLPVAILAGLVIFAYFLVNNGFIALVFLDAIELVGGPRPELTTLYMVVGLLFVVAVPIYVADKVRRRYERRRGKRS